MIDFVPLGEEPWNGEVVCIDNIGMENDFLVGVSYLGEWGSDGMLNVIDRRGIERECYRDRFDLPEGAIIMGIDLASEPDKTVVSMVGKHDDKVDIRSWDVSSVASIQDMFRGCNNLNNQIAQSLAIPKDILEGNSRRIVS